MNWSGTPVPGIVWRSGPVIVVVVGRGVVVTPTVATSRGARGTLR